MGENTALYICGGVTCCVLLITSIILLVCSFSTLEPNEVGIEYNANTMHINKAEKFESGRHFLGLGHSFIVYPKTLQQVRFASGNEDGAINARTKDGLLVWVSMSFNFRLITSITDLSQLYLDFGDMGDVTTAYKRIARNWVRAVAANFTAFEFFFNRTEFQTQLRVTLDTKLRETHASVDSVQLLGVDMPVRFNDARVQQETAVQLIEQAEEQRNVAQINAETRVAKAQAEARVITLEATAQSERIRLEAEATVASLQARFAAEKESYVALAAELGFTVDQLLAYIWLDAMEQGVAGSTLNVEVPTSIAAFGL